MSLKKIQFLPLLIVLACIAFPVTAQDLASVKGKIVQSKYKDFQIPYEDLGARLLEQVQLPQPPLPSDWNKKDMKARQAWMKSFQESEKGKAFVKNNQAIIAKSNKFDVKIEKNGDFIVYDVPPGKYGLRGRVDKELKNRQFAFEVFGQVEVLKEVDELVLEPIMILVTPLLKVGEPAPRFKVSTHDKSADLVPKHFQGKHLFLNFWSTESPPSMEFQPEVQKLLAAMTQKKQPFELLSINVDAKRADGIGFIKKKRLQGRHGFTDGWDHTMLEAYGVRALPSHWLIDPNGKILMTHMDFRRAFFSGKPDLATIVDDRIQGKDVPTLAEPAKKEDK